MSNGQGSSTQRSGANKNFEERLARVEGLVERLGETVDEWIQSSKKRDQDIYNRFENLQQAFQQSRQTNWPVVIGLGTVAIMFASMMAGLVMFSMNASVSPMQVRNQLQDQQLQTLKESSYQVPQLEARVRALEREHFGLRYGRWGPGSPGQAPESPPASR